MRHLVGGPWVVSRLRAALLTAVGVAAVLDLATFVAVAGDDDGPRPVDAQVTGPDEVARQVIAGVADDDCSGLADRFAADAELSFAITSCLAGKADQADLSDVRVVATTTDGDGSAVTVALAADGRDARVVVDLRRDDDRWLVTGVRPVAG